MLAVPMLAGDEVMGVIVLSSLGYGMFDEDDQRVLEVLAAHAGAAFKTRAADRAEREAAQTAAALLRRFAAADLQTHAQRHLPGGARDAALDRPVRRDGRLRPRPETGAFRLAQLHAAGNARSGHARTIADVPAEVANGVAVQRVGAVRRARARWSPTSPPTCGSPSTWPTSSSPPCGGSPTASARSSPSPRTGASSPTRTCGSSAGLTDITSLALGNARRLSELERFHDLVGSLDATFWEAEAGASLFTFVGAAPPRCSGRGREPWPAQERRWGEHIAELDRDVAIAACREALARREDASLEYRLARTRAADPIWVRDLIHVVRGPGGRGAPRPDGRRHAAQAAEEALRASERKYSDAFRREREAAQQLRALDEMKNTFLEAVSHDLRTPLTSILGSALTLEQSQLEIRTRTRSTWSGGSRRTRASSSGSWATCSTSTGCNEGSSRRSDGPPTSPSSIHRAVGETENPHGRTIHVEAAPVVASVDGAKVERIVENLVANALRHTQVGRARLGPRGGQRRRGA